VKKIGLALGGGGAKGLAHIPMLEVFDDLGLRPHRIAGASIGAVIGALYASGMTGLEIRDRVRRMLVAKGETFRQALKRKDPLKWFEFMDLALGRHAIFKGDRFISFLYSAMGISSFAELKIPLRVVATDFWTSEQVVLDAGELLPAVKASMGLPGVFAPVILNDRVLIDGGGVNPVPHDLLDDCDIVVAIDAMGRMRQTGHKAPNMFRAVLGMFDIMQNSIIAQRLKNSSPDIYIKPDISGVDILDFHKAEAIYGQAEPAQRKLRQELMRALRRFCS
jgi:NTE family protein